MRRRRSTGSRLAARRPATTARVSFVPDEVHRGLEEGRRKAGATSLQRSDWGPGADGQAEGGGVDPARGVDLTGSDRVAGAPSPSRLAVAPTFGRGERRFPGAVTSGSVRDHGGPDPSSTLEEKAGMWRAPHHQAGKRAPTVAASRVLLARGTPGDLACRGAPVTGRAGAPGPRCPGCAGPAEPLGNSSAGPARRRPQLPPGELAGLRTGGENVAGPPPAVGADRLAPRGAPPHATAGGAAIEAAAARPPPVAAARERAAAAGADGEGIVWHDCGNRAELDATGAVVTGERVDPVGDEVRVALAQRAGRTGELTSPTADAVRGDGEGHAGSRLRPRPSPARPSGRRRRRGTAGSSRRSGRPGHAGPGRPPSPRAARRRG